MRIPDPLIRCPVFLGVNRTASDRSNPWFAGTGFLVAVEQRGEVFSYIVTARHIVDDIKEHAKKNPGASFVRSNDATGKAFQASLLGTTWVTSPDPMVDLAVCPIVTPNQGLCMIPTTAFVKPDDFGEYGIGLGDEVFTLGLLSFAVSSTKNVPVVRYGNLAMLPEEPLQTKLGAREAYLIEARSIGGLSGSPVFVRETLWLNPESSYRVGDERQPTPPMLTVGRTFLLGVMRGHWDITPETIGSINVEGKAGGVNMGIAMVTPVGKLMDLLHGPVLTKEREDLIKDKSAHK